MKEAFTHKSLLILGRGIGQVMLPGFTTLFILSVWMLLGLCSWLMPDMLLVSDTETPASSSINYLQCFSMSIGQVMFQGNIMTGLFFLAGILVNSRNAAVYTILGVLLPLPLAILLGADSEALNIGLMGYNGVLCAIALGGKSWMSLYGLYVPFYSLLYCKLWE